MFFFQTLQNVILSPVLVWCIGKIPDDSYDVIQCNTYAFLARCGRIEWTTVFSSISILIFCVFKLSRGSLNVEFCVCYHICPDKNLWCRFDHVVIVFNDKNETKYTLLHAHLNSPLQKEFVSFLYILNVLRTPCK